jgi:hypothetical protein
MRSILLRISNNLKNILGDKLDQMKINILIIWRCMINKERKMKNKYSN